MLVNQHDQHHQASLVNQRGQAGRLKMTKIKRNKHRTGQELVNQLAYQYTVFVYLDDCSITSSLCMRVIQILFIEFF